MSKKVTLISKNYYAEELGDIEQDVSDAIQDSKVMADDTDEHGFTKGHLTVIIEYIPESEDKPCKSYMGVGPGHQSRLQCGEQGTHVIHRAYYDYGGYTAYWKGNEAFSGFFDDVPGNGDLEVEYYEEHNED